MLDCYGAGAWRFGGEALAPPPSGRDSCWLPLHYLFGRALSDKSETRPSHPQGGEITDVKILLKEVFFGMVPLAF